MTDLQLRIQVDRLIIHSGFEKSEAMLSPIVKIIKMRNSEFNREQVLRITKDALK